METLAWIGLSQSLFAAILIGTKRDNSISDKILTGWLVLLAIEFLTCSIDYKVFKTPLLSNSFLLINPAFYLYIKSLTKRDFKLKWLQLLHLVPYTAFEISVYILQEPLSFNTILDKSGNLIFRIFLIIITFLSWILYNAASSNLVHKHRKNLVNEFSSIENNNKIVWIIFIIFFYISFCIITLSLGFYSYFAEKKILLPYFFTYSVMLLLVYIIGYYGLMQKRIYTKSNEEPFVKYKNSFLSSKKKDDIKNFLIKYFEEEKPYLNSEINLDFVSKQLDVPKHQLTEVLNMEIGKNFFQFVNMYRIEAVKKQLSDKENLYSIEAIGYDCGFSSKSSFFTVFKKMTGITPAQYKNSNT